MRSQKRFASSSVSKPKPMRQRSLKVGTRSSLLALAQTEAVIASLSRLSSTKFEKYEIATAGDKAGRRSKPPLGDGIFVKEIRRALLAGEIDLAVHSLKDLPTEPIDGLCIAAVPLREEPRDVMIGGTLAGLPAGAKVGTGSPRRAAQLRFRRPDLMVMSIRGNVPTRIEKVRKGDVDAAVVAAAGVIRLGLEFDELLSADDMLPAPGQGALAVEVRAEDVAIVELVSHIDHPDSRTCVEAERRVLSGLGGGCLVPIGTLARIHSGELRIEACVTSDPPEGEAPEQIRERASGPASAVDDIVSRMITSLKQKDALRLLDI